MEAVVLSDVIQMFVLYLGILLCGHGSFGDGDGDRYLLGGSCSSGCSIPDRTLGSQQIVRPN